MTRQKVVDPEADTPQAMCEIAADRAAKLV